MSTKIVSLFVFSTRIVSFFQEIWSLHAGTQDHLVNTFFIGCLREDYANISINEKVYTNQLRLLYKKE